MKKIITSFVIGTISGALFIMYLSKEKNIYPSKIKVTQISGKKIFHSNWNFKGASVDFNTESEGKGKIKTSIPKSLIPEANAWMNKINSIQFNYIYQYYDSHFNNVYGLSYWRRWNEISIGGGVIVSKDSVGVQTGVQYSW